MQKVKDFGQYYLKKNNSQQFYDPFLYTTKEVEEQILQMQQEGFISIGLGNLAGLILTAPFQTIITSLQLSVQPHKNVFQAPVSKSKQLVKTTKALTVQQKRKLQLTLRTGQDHKPYTAPVYDGYRSVIKGLMNQGFRAFYKGLTFRCIHQLSHIYSFTQITLLGQHVEQQGQKLFNFFKNIMKIYAIQTICDISFNALYIAQNRYILQNNIAEFKVFRNINRVFSKLYTKKQIFRGYSYHIYNNIGQLFIKTPFLFSLVSNNYNQAISIAYICYQILMYPVSTAFKRLVCQHKDIPGMIPMRYSSLGHALRLIFQQQGLKGLYKGIGLYQINLLVKIGFMDVILNGRSREQ